MKIKVSVFLLCALLFGVASFAHNGVEHIMGTVKTISPNSITVETAAKEPKLVAISLLPTTKFQKDGTDTSVKTLKVGDRVVVNAKPNGDKLEALAVIFGKMPMNPDMPGMDMHQ